MRSAPVLALVLLVACSKRTNDAPKPSLVKYETSYAVYDESGNKLLLCLDESVTLSLDAGPPAPATRNGAQRLPNGQRCSSFGKKDVASCTASKAGIVVHYFDVGVVTDDDSESRDCVASGGMWKLDEREVSKARLERLRKRL